MTPTILALWHLASGAAAIAVGANGELSLDGQPWEDAAACARLAGQTVSVGFAPEAPWDALTPALLEARRCGWRLRFDDGEGGWRALDAPGTPLVVVQHGRKPTLLLGGAAAEVALHDDSHLKLFELAAPLGTPLCLFASERTPAELALATAAMLTGTGRRGLCVVTAADRARLAPPDQTLLAHLLGEELPTNATAPRPDGALTRALGSSRSVAAIEREVPAWLDASSLICRDGEQTVLWGIGSVSGIKNHALARSTAANRARAEIAKLIRVDVQRSADGLRTSTAMTLSGVSIAEQFADEETVWALATMPAPEGVTATATCPTGRERVTSWAWRPVAADGGAAPPRPAWANPGPLLSEEELSLTYSLIVAGPLAESVEAASRVTRARFAAALTGAAAAASDQRGAGGVHCLLALPLSAAVETAELETWHDPEEGTVVARVRLPLAELRAALPPGCADTVITSLATRAAAEPDERPDAVATAPVDYPDWVERGSGAFNDATGKVFFGVGSVSGIKNHALARTTADNRARAELAQMLEVFSAVSMKDYLSHNQATAEGAVESAIRTLSVMTLSGVQIVDHWYHPDGTVYALAQLDLESWKNNAGKSREVDAKLRAWVSKHAERLHEQLEREASR